MKPVSDCDGFYFRFSFCISQQNCVKIELNFSRILTDIRLDCICTNHENFSN